MPKRDEVLEGFLSQTFSTTEAAAILDIPVETLRTQLKQGWLPIPDDRAPGKWRRIGPEDLLHARLTKMLSDQGIPFPEAKRIIGTERPTWFGGTVYLYAALNREGRILDFGKCGVRDLGIRLGEARKLSSDSAPERPSVAVVIALNPEQNWIRDRLHRFYSKESAS